MHEKYMRECIRLGYEAMLLGNAPVGSILVYEDHIISSATEASRTTGDVTDHAEIIAIRKGLSFLTPQQLQSAVLYSTHEPCVMCAYAIRHYGIGTVVYGKPVPFAGGDTSNYNLLHDREHPRWNEPPGIIKGILQDECDKLSVAYEQHKEKKR
ncbi:tRNA(adenine34) deaminase [Chitinophaga skermanii]|uniref:tRNA(Adenine34) deaminase n=1 Tax=Chitinophaga skermanii TaxID=331697 RepID=A0A327R1E4_9BACT|nr:nucleoside deaminase [Chitinophaga skermanii]RAJ10696.1 tRNA(adenine34) deaminase [Chitinophaga skermanii]